LTPTVCYFAETAYLIITVRTVSDAVTLLKDGNTRSVLSATSVEARRVTHCNASHINVSHRTDRVRLNFVSKNRINRVLELELEHTDNDCRMF